MIRRTLVEKLIILERARKTGNVTKTCQDFGISRISYYHIKKTVANFVSRNKSPRSDVSANHEITIMDMVLTNPSISTCGISEKLLSEHNIRLSHTTVHVVLKKLDLNRHQQRWLHLESQLKYAYFAKELSVRQRLFMQNHNPCFSAYHRDLIRPFEQLNLDVVKTGNHRICIAIDPSINYAFVLLLPKMDRKKILHWLDTQVFPKAMEFGLPVKTVATSDLKLFDRNIDGTSDYDSFDSLLQKHDLKQISQYSVKPVLDGSIQYFYQLLSVPVENFSTKQPDPKIIAKELAAWLKNYNHHHQYPYYPTYGLSPVAMMNYYLKHGENWRGPKSLTARLGGYISPLRALGVAKGHATLDNGQANSIYSSWVSSLFK